MIRSQIARIKSLIGLGIFFHLFVISFVTLMGVLENLRLLEALRWVALLLSILIIPALVLIYRARQRGKYTYQREMRTPIYIVGWFSVLVCFAIIYLANGPERLMACFAALTVWLPLQMGINGYFTKISTHTGVTAGCVTGLLLFGVLDIPLLQMMALLVVVLTAWARHKTRNHSWQQIIMGWVIASGTVLATFPFFL